MISLLKVSILEMYEVLQSTSLPLLQYSFYNQLFELKIIYWTTFTSVQIFWCYMVSYCVWVCLSLCIAILEFNLLVFHESTFEFVSNVLPSLNLTWTVYISTSYTLFCMICYLKWKSRLRYINVKSFNTFSNLPSKRLCYVGHSPHPCVNWAFSLIIYLFLPILHVNMH